MKRRLLSILLTVAILLSATAVFPVTIGSANEEHAYRCGDADGNGLITILDALEVLIFLAGMETPINSNPRARIAASGPTRNNTWPLSGDINPTRPETVTPNIMDALEILMTLAGMNGFFSQFGNANCRGWAGTDCNWCRNPSGGGPTNTPPDLPSQTPPTSPPIIPPSFLTDNMPGGIVGQYYDHEIPVHGTAPITINVTNPGNLADFGLSVVNGRVVGTPTQPGIAQFTVEATNGADNAFSNMFINVADIGSTPPPISDITLPPNPTPAPTEPPITPGPTEPPSTPVTDPPITTIAATTTSPAPTTTTEPEGELRPRFLRNPNPRGVVAPESDNFPGGFYTGSGEFFVHMGHDLDWEIWVTFASAQQNRNGNGVEADLWQNTINSGVSFQHPRLARHDGGVSPVVLDNRGHAQNQLTRPGQPTGAQNYHERFPNGIRISRSRCAFTISAVARNPANQELSEVRTRTWINGVANVAPSWSPGSPANNASARFHQDMLIISIYSDAMGIFDRARGVFCDGAADGGDRHIWVTEYARLNNQSRESVYNEMDDHRTQGNYPPTLPANFTKRGRIAAERPAHIEIFHPTGEREFSQRVGIRVKGGWSRGTFVLEQKTFEIYSRSGMGDRGNILYPLFGNHYDVNGNLIQRYERFRIRNGGSDREQTYMRDELAQDLARLAGAFSAQVHRPGVAYLNGAYYGLVWFRSPRTNDMWQRLYGGSQFDGPRESGFEMIGANEMGRDPCGRNNCGRPLPNQSTDDAIRSTFLFGPRAGQARLLPRLCTDTRTCGRSDCSDYHSSWNDDRGATRGSGTHCAPGGSNPTGRNCRGVASWAEVIQAATGGNMENPTLNFTALSALMDIDQVIHYYALNIWGGNCDWPSNNVEMWRYFPNAAERTGIAAGTTHPHLDGRWRMVIQDFEFGYGLFQNGSPVANATHATNNTIHALRHRTGTTTHVPGNRATVPSMDGTPPTDEPRYHFNAVMSTSFMIPALLSNERTRSMLANALSDVIENSHAATVNRPVYDYLRWTIENEHRRMMGQGINGSNQAPGRTASHNDDAWDLARQRGNSDNIRIAELPRSGETAHQSPNFPLPGLIFEGNQLDGGHLHLTDFLRDRNAQMQNHIAAPYAAGPSNPSATANSGLGLAWGSRATVTATITNARGDNQGGTAILNTIPFGWHQRDAMNGTWVGSNSVDPRLRNVVTGRYHFGGGVQVPITVQPWPGWTANVTGATRVGTTNNYFVTGAATVSITFVRETAPRLMITAYRTNNQSSYIQVTNVGGGSASTAGFFLTQGDGGANGILNLQQFAIPTVSLAAGESITIVNRSHTVTNQDENFDRRTDFNLSNGERLRLTTGGRTLEEGGRILQTVEIFSTPATGRLTGEPTASNIWDFPTYRFSGGRWRLDGMS